jgi:hypothetical protein
MGCEHAQSATRSQSGRLGSRRSYLASATVTDQDEFEGGWCLSSFRHRDCCGVQRGRERELDDISEGSQVQWDTSRFQRMNARLRWWRE